MLYWIKGCSHLSYCAVTACNLSTCSANNWQFIWHIHSIKMYSLTSFCYSKSKNHSNKTEQIYIHINLLISNVNLKTSGQVINNFLFFLDKKKKRYLHGLLFIWTVRELPIYLSCNKSYEYFDIKIKTAIILLTMSHCWFKLLWLNMFLYAYKLYTQFADCERIRTS